MKTTNLHRGAVAFPLFLVSMDSQDDLQVSVVASYQSNVKNMVESSNREYESSTLGLGWSIEVPRIVVKNRLVKESFDSSFYLVAEGGIYPLYRLGTEGDAISFYSVEHPYWKFYFFNAPKKSRWEIHKENGTVWVYGGDDSAIETRIHWDNWVGAASSNGGEAFPVDAGEELSVSESHPVVTQRGIVVARNLNAGDLLVRADGSQASLAALHKKDYHDTVYNLKIDSVSRIIIANGFLTGDFEAQNDPALTPKEEIAPETPEEAALREEFNRLYERLKSNQLR